MLVLLLMHRLVSLCLILLFVTTSGSTAAEASADPTPPPAARIAPGNPSTLDPAAATRAWLETVPAEKRAKSDAYFEGGYWLLLWNFLLAAAVFIFLLESGI